MVYEPKGDYKIIPIYFRKKTIVIGKLVCTFMLIHMTRICVTLLLKTMLMALKDRKTQERGGGGSNWVFKIKNSMTRLVILVCLNLNYFSPPAKVISSLSIEVLIH